VITSIEASPLPEPSTPSTWDFRILGGAMGSDALTGDYSIYYRLSGGGVSGTEYGPVPIGSFLMADGQQYGSDVSVQARACRSYDSVPVCQTEWSAPQHLGVPVNPSISGFAFEPTGFPEPVNGSGTFSWLGWPSGAYEGVEYACGAQPGGTFVPADTSQSGSCHAEVGLLQTAYLTIRVIANSGNTYDITYPG
jgi:large repetitive protein